jgi:cbb3-type cytochrome oxidase maturation protein
MSAIFVLIGVSLVVATGFLIAFIWSVKSGQYEDGYTPSVRILFDDQPSKQTPPEKKSKTKTRKKWKFKNFTTTTKS